MKSWFMQSAADQATLELRDVPIPEPGTGQILVNGRPVEQYFGRQTSIMVVRQRRASP